MTKKELIEALKDVPDDAVITYPLEPMTPPEVVSIVEVRYHHWVGPRRISVPGYVYLC